MATAMRSLSVAAVVLALAAAACSHASRPVYPTKPVGYSCPDTRMTRNGAALVFGTTEGRNEPTWHDDAGDHYLIYPGHTGIVVEVVTPNDPLADATRVIYDVSKATSQSEWRQLGRQTCTVDGGYSDVLARYARGTSIEQLAVELDLPDRDDARARLHKALTATQRRYWRER